MKAIILAAGYGTRLQEGLDKLKIEDKAKYDRIKDSIEGKHKALVELDGRPLIDYTVENILRAGIDNIYVITNHKFFKKFKKWKQDYDGNASLIIVDDKTICGRDVSQYIKKTYKNPTKKCQRCWELHNMIKLEPMFHTA